MPLIDRTYFDRSLILDVVDHEAAIDAAIAEYEPEYLRALLGPSLYAAFSAGLIAGNRSYFSAQFSDQFLKSPLDDRWRWIKEGHTFTVSGRTMTWPGLVSTAKKSPIANYVYWHYRRDNVTSVTDIGEASMQTENGAVVSPKRKMATAWNRMVDMNGSLFAMVSYLTVDDALVYPEFERCTVGLDVYYHQNEFGI